MASTLENIEALEAPLRVIKYSLNSSGELSKMYTAIDNTIGAAALLNPVVDDARPVLYSRNSATEQGSTSLEGKLMYKNGTFYPLFHMNSTTGVIQVPVDEAYRTSEEYYTSHSQSSLDSATDNIENQPFYGYDVHNGTAKFILWPRDGSGSTEVGEGGSAIIEAVTTGVNENGDPVKVFKAYMNKTWTKFYSKGTYNDTETTLKETVEKILAQTETAAKKMTSLNKKVVNADYATKHDLPSSYSRDERKLYQRVITVIDAFFTEDPQTAEKLREAIKSELSVKKK